MAVEKGSAFQESQLPKLGGLQFDSGGGLVNLFRGSSSFPIQLLSLPGRNGLEYGLSLFYQGDQAKEQVGNWSLNRPEEVAGVGWSLPYERIIVETRQNESLEDNQYYLVMNGQPSPLLPVSNGWRRGILAASYQTDLPTQLGPQSILPALRQGFLDAQIDLSLDEDNRIEVIGAVGSGRYLVKDVGYERDYNLIIQEDGTILISTGGISFELYSYQYWRISYYSEYERWEIVRNNGSIHSYGGKEEKYRIDSETNAHTKQYGVKWGNWIGPSTQTGNQERYVTAWNLAKVSNPLGNYYLINYQVVEQEVKEAGDNTQAKSYTKECLVHKVKNDLEWSVEYDYLDKVYDISSLESPKEYVDPHKDPSVFPGVTPDAYQSRYTTKYLNRLYVKNAQGEVESWTEFDYYGLWNPNDLPSSWNNDQEKVAYGATYDRYLKSITQYTGKSLGYPMQMSNRYGGPGLLFDYNFTTDSSKPRGLIKTIVNSTGGKTEFTYELKTLKEESQGGLGQRSLSVGSPGGSLEAVRSWTGGDYIVTAWYNSSTSLFTLKVYTWVGGWQVSSTEYKTTRPVDMDRVQVSVSENTFAVSLSPSGPGQSLIKFFVRDKLRRTEWGVEAGSNLNNIIYNSFQVSLFGGDNYYLVQDADNGLFDRYTYDAREGVWDKASFSVDPNYTRYVAAGQKYYVVFDYNASQEAGNYHYYGMDLWNNWTYESSLLNVPMSIPGYNGFKYFQMAASSSYVGISRVTGYTPNGPNSFSKFNYKAEILTWTWNTSEKKYDLSLPTISNIENGTFNNIPSSVIISSMPGIYPVPIENRGIGTGPNYLWYDGINWQCETIGIDYEGFANPSHQYYWYTYNGQAILKTENTDSGVISKIRMQDPSNPGAGWIEEELLNVPPTAERYYEGYPTSGAEGISQGGTLYSVPLSSNWTGISSDIIGDINNQLSATNESLDSTTLINGGSYLIFLIQDQNGTAMGTGVVYLKNRLLIKDAQGDIDLDRFDGDQIYRSYDTSHYLKGNQSGKRAQTARGFVSYPLGVTSLDEVSSIKLHRYSGEKLQGDLSGFVVKSIRQHTGFYTGVTPIDPEIVDSTKYQVLAKGYVYKDARASADGFKGAVLKFDQVEERVGYVKDPGSETEQEIYKDGKIVSHFYNGVAPSSQSPGSFTTPYSMLDGQLNKKEVYDQQGILKESTEMGWDVLTSIARNPDGTGLQNIYGGYPVVRDQVQMKEGIQTFSTNTYSMYSGAVTNTEGSYFDAKGQQIGALSEVTYAYEKYEGIVNQNLLTLQAQTKSYVQNYSTAGKKQLVSSNVQTYKLWELELGAVKQWGTAANYIALNSAPTEFSWWNNTGVPDDTWRKTNEVLERGEEGNVLVSEDVEGRKTTSIYDDTHTFLLASFSNAAIEDEVGLHYSSFEPYQAGDTWTESNANITPTDAFLGSQCYQLSGGGTSSIEKVVSNVALQTTAPQFYCFNLWIKTPKNADPSDSITLEIDAPGSTGALIKSVDLTEGQWAGKQWVADLAGLGITGTADLTLKINYTSTVGSSYLRVDQVLFSPQQSPFAAQVYDMDKFRVLGAVSANEVSEKTLYSIWESGLTGIGVYDQTSGLGTGYSVRQNLNYDPLNDNFPIDVPNTSVSFGGREKGFYDTYRNAESLDNYIVESGLIGSWESNNSALSLTSGTGEQRLSHSLDITHSNDIAAYVDVVPTFMPGESNPDLEISFGTKEFLVKWEKTQWHLLQWNWGTSSYDSLEVNTEIDWQPSWHYVIIEDRLLFLANGILIFDYKDVAVGAVTNREIALGGVYDTLNNRGFEFKNLVVLEDIQMGLSYSDGVGRGLQSLAIESSTETILSTQIYDYLGRAPIGVLPARLVQGTGPGEVENVLAYYPDYITNREVESGLWSGEPMTGPVVEIYHPDSLVDPQDPSKGGYPFSRTVFETSPLGRPLQSGAPGEKFALLPNNGNPHITSYEYGINSREGTSYEDPKFLFYLPEDQYYKTKATDPDGNQVVQYKTIAGQVVGTIKTGPNGAEPIKSSNVYNMRGERLHGIPPTYYENNLNPQTGVIPVIATTFTYDSLGRAIENSYPDSNERGFSTKVIYDKANRPRFMLDGQGDLINYYNYIKYDVLGREIEKGVCNEEWDQAALELEANNSDYPTTNINISNTTVYDGDETTSHMVGRLWKTMADNADGGAAAARITQIMTYNATGEVLNQEQQFVDGSSAVVEGEGISTYTYTINGRLITSTENKTDVTETYSVNRLGQLTETYVDTGSKHVKAVYTYDQEGAIEKAELYKPDNTLLTDRNFTYLPNGWLKETDGGFVDQSLKYTEGSCDTPSEGYYNGALSHNKVGYNGLTNAPNSDYCYDVDHMNRVKVAKNHDSQQVVTDTYGWDFDNNSNFTSHTINSEIRTYTTLANTNRLESITSTGSYDRQFTYNLTGDTENITGTSGNNLGIGYNRWNGKAKRITNHSSSRRVEFDYGPNNGRARKRVYDAANSNLLHTTYNALGMVEIEKDTTPTLQTKRHIGLAGAGLVYWKEADTFYWILPDELGSTRMIVDEIATVIRGYNYEVYGYPTKVIETASALIYNYLFTGQYWDEELELYNYHARFYDPSIARFLQIDPAHQGFSPYVYVGGMPDIATDPSGRFIFSLTAIMGTIIAGIGGIYYGVGEAQNSTTLSNVGKSLLLIGSFLVLGAGAGALWATAAGSVTVTAASMPLLGAVSAGSAIIPEAITATQEASLQEKPVEFNFGRMAAMASVNFVTTILSGGGASALSATQSGTTLGSFLLRAGGNALYQSVLGGISGAAEGAATSAASGGSAEEISESARNGFLGGMFVGFISSALSGSITVFRAVRAKSLIRGNITAAKSRAVKLGLSKRDIDLVGRLDGVNARVVERARSSASIRKIIDNVNPGSTWRSSRNTVPRLIGHANDFLHDSIGQRAQSASFLRDGVLGGRNNIPTSFAETVSFMGVPTSITVFGRLSFYNEWVKTWGNAKHASK